MTGRKARKTKTPTTGLLFRVLGYLDEDGGWVAHCLETDLVGEGKNWDEAMASLMDLTETQISFAIHKGNPGLILHPAPMHVVERYQNRYDRTLASYPRLATRDESEAVSFFRVPDPPKKPESFTLANG